MDNKDLIIGGCLITILYLLKSKKTAITQNKTVTLTRNASIISNDNSDNIMRDNYIVRILSDNPIHAESINEKNGKVEIILKGKIDPSQVIGSIKKQIPVFC